MTKKKKEPIIKKEGPGIMIRFTRLNNTEVVINGEMIECIESTPDTILTLTTGKKVMIKDSVDEVIAKFKEYRRDINQLIVKQLKE